MARPYIFILKALKSSQKFFPQGKKSILRKPSSQRADPSVRVKFNPLALLLDASLEGEYDLVQRVIYEVSPTVLCQSRHTSRCSMLLVPLVLVDTATFRSHHLAICTQGIKAGVQKEGSRMSFTCVKRRRIIHLQG